MAVTIKGFASDWSVPEPAKAALGGTFATLDAQGRQPVRKDELVINVRDYGAIGNGTTDDGPAIRAARSAAVGKVLFFPPGTYRYVATASFNVASNTTLRGVPRQSKILFETATPGSYAVFCHNSGANTRLEGLDVVRNADFPTVFFTVNGYNNVTVDDCMFDGRRDIYTNYAHGFQIGMNTGLTNDGLTVTNSTLTRMAYGLFQTNGSGGISRNITFQGCMFRENYMTDLEFNSPNTDTFNVLVEGCRFLDNKLTATGAGFGVGLAHVTGAIIRGNVFNGYANEAVHVEDYSTDVIVEGNSFKRCGLERAAYIRVISGSSEVTVARNHIDARANTIKIPVLHFTMGGSGGGLTPGGRAGLDPFNITVQGNRVLAGICEGAYLSFASNTIVADNVFIGAGKVTGLVYDNANTAFGIDVWGGNSVTVRGNQFRGFRHATPRRTSGTTTGGEGFTLQGNTVEDCLYGISLVNPGTCVVSGNIVRNTVYPLLVGQGNSVGAKPAVITGNHADGCKYPMEIGGTLMVVAAAAAADGATSISVEPLGMSIAGSHVITFPSGAVFTPSSGAAGATTISGTLSGGAVSAGDAGKITNVWHSWTSGNNRVAISGNIDSVAKTYGTQVTHSPNGTRYRVAVSDAAALTVTAF